MTPEDKNKLLAMNEAILYHLDLRAVEIMRGIRDLTIEQNLLTREIQRIQYEISQLKKAEVKGK